MPRTDRDPKLDVVPRGKLLERSSKTSSLTWFDGTQKKNVRTSAEAESLEGVTIVRAVDPNASRSRRVVHTRSVDGTISSS